MELIVYAGIDNNSAVVADGTIRISAYAFACSDVRVVTLAHTVEAIGHKAFFGCNALQTVVFTSYEAPVFEEEFDSAYYESLEHLPGTGDFGTYQDYDGTEVTITGMGLIPYFMWNASGGMYSNCFYGANFVDYIGYVDNKLTMVKPVNGQHYETYITGQYFGTVVNGAAGADAATLMAITLIDQLPNSVSLSDRPAVEAARAAYNKVVNKEQQALIKNYSKLDAAEKRLQKLSEVEEEQPSTEPTTPDVPVQEQTEEKTNLTWLAWVVLGLGVVGVVVAVVIDRARNTKKKSAAQSQNQE
jgi:hypothetical protein